MKFEERPMAGSAGQLVKRSLIALVAAGLLLATAGNSVLTQVLYKYRGPDGEWIYTDRAPQDETPVEIRALPKGMTDPRVTVYHEFSDGQFKLIARNEYYAPVEVILALDSLDNISFPPPEYESRWVVAPRSRSLLMQLDLLEVDAPANARYRHVWLPGDPDSVHTPTEPYRAPFAVANRYRISQAFPIGITHKSPDSYYAVDITMPVGTNVYSARAGTVFEVASTNFRGGIDPERDLPAANLIRILHDDGTYAVYAHLNWNTIRVQPGDTVEKGEYIADSGNTGFSTGPHLHFAVIRNKGLQLESVPVVFEGQNNQAVEPATGSELVAY
jgi:murein DD-endopeptidase MepM/ murein hydrolase activator NlpD